MLNGEFPPHWNDLVAQNSESTTDENINISNIWADQDLSHEGDQDNIDPNLVLTRSFHKTPSLNLKSISFDKQLYDSAVNPQSKN